MREHLRDAGMVGGRFTTLCALVAILLFSVPASAQQKEVLTFQGKDGPPIKIVNEKGEVKEEVSEEQLKRIIVRTKLRIPQQKENAGEAEGSTRNSAKTDPTIDEMLKKRQANLKKRRASA
ncbi:MAG: hypothetical protein VCC01_06290, partial [Candidatus Hydrogenedentota bacterium]